MSLVLNCWEVASSNGSKSSLTIRKPTLCVSPQWNVDVSWKSPIKWGYRNPSAKYSPAWNIDVAWAPQNQFGYRLASGDYLKNPEIGDFLIIVVGNDNATNTAQWDDSTLKPTGFTLINETGTSTDACHCAAFYKIVDGTEGDDFTIPAQASANMWAACILISGDGSQYIHQIGADSSVASAVIGTPLSISSVVTTVSKTLGLFVAAYDGGDFGTFTCTGSVGWSTRSTMQNGTSANVASGLFGYKNITDIGDSSNVTVYAAVGDGMTGFQFAIGEMSVFAPADDEWVSTTDDFWYGIGLLITAVTSGLKATSTQKSGLINFIPTTLKSICSKLVSRKQSLDNRLVLMANNIGFKIKSIISLDMRLRLLVNKIGSKIGTAFSLLEVIAGETQGIALTVKNAASKLKTDKILNLWHTFTVSAKRVGIKFRATKASFLLTIPINLKNAKSKLMAMRLPSPWRSFISNAKTAIFKIRSSIPVLSTIGSIILTVKTAASKLVSSKKVWFVFQLTILAKKIGSKIISTRIRNLIRVFTLSVKRSILKLTSRKLPAMWKSFTSLARICGIKARSILPILSGGIVISLTVKKAGIKLRATRSIIYEVIDHFISTVDDFWVSTIDNEWFGIIILRVHTIRSKIRSLKVPRPIYSVPVRIKNVTKKMRARKSSLTIYLAVIQLAIKNAKIKLKANRTALSFSAATIFLAIKNSKIKFKAKARVTFSYLFLRTKSSKVKFHIDRFFGWTLNIPMISAKLKIQAARNKFSFLILARNVRLKLRTGRSKAIGALKLYPKKLGLKLIGRRIFLVRIITMIPRISRLRIKSGKRLISRSYVLFIKPTVRKMVAVPSWIGFSFAIITLPIKNAVRKMRATQPIISAYYAVAFLYVKSVARKMTVSGKSSLVMQVFYEVKQAGIKLTSHVSSQVMDMFLYPKKAFLKIRALSQIIARDSWLKVSNNVLKLMGQRSLSSFSEIFVSLKNATIRMVQLLSSVGTVRVSVKDAIIKFTSSKLGQPTARIDTFLKNAILKIRLRRSPLILKLFISAVRSGFKLISTISWFSMFRLLGIKIARLHIRATKRVITRGGIIWFAIAKFLTKALEYRFYSSGSSMKFESKSEDYKFVSKNQ